MADRELTLDLLARDRTGPATKAVADHLDDVADAADDAAKATDQFSRSSTEAAEESEKFGRASRTAKDHVERLDHEIHRVNQDLVLLAAQMAEADDAAARMDVSKGIRKAEAELRRFTKSRGILAGLIPDEPEPEQTRGFGRKLVSSIAAGVASAPASLAEAAGNKVGLTVGAAAGAAAVPVLVSVMGTALAAQAGAGFIGLGIMQAVKGDKNLQAAGKAAGDSFTHGLQDAAQKSFSGPILQSISILSQAGERLTATWSGAFDKLSGSVVPLTRDVVQAAESINGALVRAASNSGPALEGLGDSLRLLADGAANFIDAVADGGPEAASNLQLIAGATGDLLTMTGNFLSVLNKAANNEWLTGPLLPILRKHYKDVADESEDLAGSTEFLADKMSTAQKAANGEREALSLLSKELKAQTDPVFGLLDAEEKLAKAQKDAAEATKKHGRDSDEAKAALRRLAEAAVDVEGKAGALGKTFDGKMTPALRATLSAAGLTKSEINRLEQQFVEAKKDGDRFAKKYAASAVVNGAAKAKNDLYTLRAIANSIDGRTVSIGMRITGVSNVSKAAAAIRKQYYSTGGPVAGPGTSTSDSVPAMLSKGEFVVRAAAASKPGVRNLLERLNTGQMASTPANIAGAGMAGAAAQTVHLVVHTAPDADRRVTSMFRYALRSTGSDATVAGGI